MDAVEKVRELVKPQYDSMTNWRHRWLHVSMVAENSETLAKMESLDSNSRMECLIAAYCHDLGRIEEERRKKRGDSPLPHALLSIEPTVHLLQEVGISGINFNEIVEAVAVHSYRVYEGKNPIAQVLQDADKMTALMCGCGLDILDLEMKSDSPKEDIIKSLEDPRKRRGIIDYLFRQVKSREAAWEITNVSGRMLEYKDMFHTSHAYGLVKEDHEFLSRCRDYLVKKFNLVSKA